MIRNDFVRPRSHSACDQNTNRKRTKWTIAHTHGYNAITPHTRILQQRLGGEKSVTEHVIIPHNADIPRQRKTTTIPPRIAGHRGLLGIISPSRDNPARIRPLTPQIDETQRRKDIEHVPHTIPPITPHKIAHHINSYGLPWTLLHRTRNTGVVINPADRTPAPRTLHSAPCPTKESLMKRNIKHVKPPYTNPSGLPRTSLKLKWTSRHRNTNTGVHVLTLGNPRYNTYAALQSLPL
jgi:hypothetical protein